MKKLLTVILSLTMMLGMGIPVAAKPPEAESQGPTGTYIKVADGVYLRDPNAPTPRYIPTPSCYSCGSTKFVAGKNTFWRYNNLLGGCPMYYNGHACYYCGERYMDEYWTNHKPDCEYKHIQ